MKVIKKSFLTVICLFIAVITAAVGYMYNYTKPTSSSHPDLSNPRYFIAHATGSIYGYVYMNCKESLMNSLENGYQFIEVDLDYTSDSVLVCVHNWEDFNKASIPGISWKDSDQIMRIPTFKEFKQRKIYGQFTPLSLDDVTNIQKKHPFTIVTDRVSSPTALNHYFKESVRPTVMVEAFSEKDYYALKKLGYIPMLSLQLITNYSDCIAFIIENALKRDIDWVVVDYHSAPRFLRLLKRMYGIKIAAYTINLPSYLYEHVGNDLDLVYTDNWNLKTKMNNYQNHTTR